MASKPLMIASAIVALVVIGITSATSIAGFGFTAAALIGLLSGALALSALQIHSARKSNEALKTAMDELQSQFVYLHERQGQAEAKLLELAKRSIDSPSLAMHAAATDIDVLGSLVHDLAKTVAEHDTKLTEQMKIAAENAVAMAGIKQFNSPLAQSFPSLASKPLQSSGSGMIQKAALPQNFETDAELGFTAELPPSLLAHKSAPALEPVIKPSAPSPAVLAELKATLSAAISGNHLDLCLQPIVMLPQRKAHGYEASVSLKGEKADGHDGTDLRRIAVATGLQRELDRTVFSRATHIARVLRARKREIAMCCAVSIESFSDHEFRSLVEDVARNDAKLARSILLEIDDAELRAAGPMGKERMASIGKLGIGLGLSLRNSLRFHAPDLVNLGIRQVRVPAQLMQSAAQSGGEIADIHPADVAELLQRNGIDLLVSDVADEDTIREMLDFAAPYAQGDLFGKARVVRPEVLEPKPVGAARHRVAAAEEPVSTGRNIPRQSFRSLLRRA